MAAVASSSSSAQPQSVKWLTRAAVLGRKGSFNDFAPAGVSLVTFDQTRGQVDIEWKAHGSASQPYTITACGKPRNGGDATEGLRVRCTCPDGEGRVSDYCKHAIAAMMTVIDPEAEEAHNERKRKLKTQEEASAAKRARLEEADRGKIEDKMPGERQRIEEGLKSLGAQKILEHLQREAMTYTGLRHIAALFPKKVLPSKKTQRCLRCGKDWDARYPKETACIMEHPYGACNTMWHTSKFSWQHCERCGRDFDPEPESNIPRSMRGTFYRSPFCFHGQHTTDKSVVAKEGWNRSGSGSESSSDDESNES